MSPASPQPLPPPLIRNHSTLSSSPSSTFDNAPGKHYLQQVEPEALEELLVTDEPLDGPRVAQRSTTKTANSVFKQRYPSSNPGRRQQQASSSSSVTPATTSMQYGVPSFHHSAGTAGNPYFNYNPSDVELSTIGMGMSMYETLNPLAATTMLVSPGGGSVGSPVSGSGRAGKRGVYAPIDSSYYSAYTQPAAGGSVFGGNAGGVESVYGGMSTVFGNGIMNGQSVNPRYISGKSEGAVDAGGKGREAILRRVKRDAGIFEEDLKKLVSAQEVALGIVGDNTGPGGAKSTRAGNGKRKMGIQEVRRGILDAMVGLADVKAVEEDWYGGEVFARDELVGIAEKWMRKRGRLEKEVEKVEAGSEGKEMERVRERLEGVEEQIRVHEAELKRLKAEQSSMLAKISDLQSTLSSRLSSYTSSIQKMSKDMTEFLKSPNALLPTPDTKATLPFTPEQAVEYWQDEKRVLNEKKQETSRELDALKDGVLIWQETVGLIADFEDMMARELVEAQREAQKEAKRQAEIIEAERRKLNRSRSPQIRTSVFGKLEDGRPGSSSTSSASGRNTPVSAFANRNRNRTGLGHGGNGSMSSSTETFKATSGSGGTTTNTGATAANPKIQPKIPEVTAARLVAGIDNVISQLNSRLTLAEQKGWTLLVCVLGAEMESYKEARATLMPLVGGLVDTSTTTETVSRVKGKGKGKMGSPSNGLMSPSDDALNESLNGLGIGGGANGFDGQANTDISEENHHNNHWNSESESEIDDPAALFGAENGGDSSPELRARASPRVRRIRAMSEEEDELEYAAFASLNLQDDNTTTPTTTTSGAGGGGTGNGRGSGGSGRSTVVGEGVKRVQKSDMARGGEEDDIHGAFLERRDSGEKPPLI
ncbi:hypothetical protein TWF191_003014 [Orbilia oligospora]|uniref:Uncharacterized protein n=2 Tax=Orbilia oligospora TaxID=2813651 RepID=A0A7C8V366_ORBOL|nr:hypothetical protein TWF679_001534 [Orbilia oligospora]KAF3228076.1 hypothetical protein TWF191_003014 [Orbilia oligospora]